MGWQAQPSLGFGLVQLVCLAFVSGIANQCKWSTCDDQNIQYFRSADTQNWTYARKACEREGGHLATPRNTVQETCIKRLVNESESWIGLYSKEAWDAPFRFIGNNEKVKMADITNWTRKPLDLNNRCIAAGTVNNDTGWFPTNCSRKLNIVCERPVTESKQVNDEGGWTTCSGQNVQYNLLNEGHGVHWGLAKSRCSNLSSVVAMLRNRVQNECVIKLTNGTLAWIGIARFNTPKYVDNSEEVENYSNWTRYQPDSPDQLCTVVWRSPDGENGWADDDCTQRTYLPICQRDSKNSKFWVKCGLDEYGLPEKSTGVNAMSTCEVENGHLATPRSQNQTGCVYTTLTVRDRSAATVWIGIAKLNNFQYIDSNNDVSKHVCWMAGQPKGSLKERCAVMVNKDDENGCSIKQCAQSTSYICQREIPCLNEPWTLPNTHERNITHDNCGDPVTVSYRCLPGYSYNVTTVSDVVRTFKCPRNQSGNEPACQDVDECSLGTHRCRQSGTQCNNTQGSYTCFCREGYTGSGVSCTDVDECTQGTHKCSPHESGGHCHNINGSYTCSCGQNFTGNRVNCTAICQVSNFSIGKLDYDFPPTNYGAFVNYSCNESSGSIFKGEHRVICFHNWPTLRCGLIYCRELSKTIEHGQNNSPLANGKSFTFGHVWLPQCEDGYKYNLREVSCTVNGTWSGVKGQCASIAINDSPSSTGTTIVVIVVPLAFVVSSLTLVAIIAIRRYKKDAKGKKELHLGRKSKLSTNPNYELSGPSQAAIGNNDQYEFAHHFQPSTQEGGTTDTSQYELAGPMTSVPTGDTGPCAVKRALSSGDADIQRTPAMDQL